jgi:hypothetical protein
MTVYGARLTNRQRATRQDMEARYEALLAITAMMQPMTVRQVFYQAAVRGIVDKSEAGYAKVQRALVDLRRAGRLPFDWIADNARWQRKPQSFRNPAEALRETARFYRKAVWAYSDEYVEVWLEKDALSAVVYDVTAEFDVPLMVARGYASLSFLHDAAQAIAAEERPAHIYHLGDYDPSGVDAANKIEATLRAFAPSADITFTRLAVLPEQITAWNLPTRPTKATDSRAKGFGTITVELDAIEAPRLRDIVRDAIERHLPARRLATIKAAEESERELLRTWATTAGTT